MSFFKNIVDAKVSERGTYFSPGSFRVKVTSVKMFTDRKGVDYYIVESEVLKSSNQEDPIGQKRNWMQKISGMESAAANVKQFAAAVTGIDLRKVPQSEQTKIGTQLAQVAEKATEGALDGQEVLLDVKTTKTKAGGDFNIHTWSPTPQASAEAAE